jgi:large subunit ribosomal protein L25
MSEELNVKIREGRGSIQSRKLRRAGKIPGIVYGHGQPPVSVELSAEEIASAVRHGVKVVDLKGGVTEKALIKALQWDIYGIDVLHVDLNRVSADERVIVELSVELRGAAPGLKEGGVVAHLLHSVEAECPVIAIPEKLQVNINHLKLGDTLTVANMEVPAGVKILTPADEIVAQCVLPTEEKEETGADAGAEPELIGRKPSDEEGEDE